MKSWQINHDEIVLTHSDPQTVSGDCVKIKLMYSSTSITDRLIAQKKIRVLQPLILGKDGVGMVVEAGANVKNCKRGDVVAIKPLHLCSECDSCVDSKLTKCSRPLVFGLNESGFLSDFAVVSQNDIVKIPSHVEPKNAVFIDYIDIAIETITKSGIEKGQHLVICGASALGIIIAQVAMYYQVVPILVDIDQSFLTLASEMGIYYTINSTLDDTGKKIFELTAGKMGDVVALVAESSYRFDQCIKYVRKGGTACVCGIEQTMTDLSMSLKEILNQRLSVFGIGDSNKHTMSAINILAGNNINVDKLILKTVDFDKAADELKHEITNSLIYLKTLIKM
ncbi:MAG: alcohol dehydrogenase catalytic domain-containing protein [Firmicutes bacterium]|nr:alcohol dehydrogenase catalytic domain-containing protein [Bacillota bacterium]